MKTLKKIGLLFCAILFFASVYGQWTQVNSGTNIILHDIFFLDSLTGYCVGGGDMWGSGTSSGAILKTIDRGLNWNVVFSDSTLAITEVVAIDNVIFCFGNKLGNSVQLTSINNGSSWKLDTFSFQVDDAIIDDSSIYFLNVEQLMRMDILTGSTQSIKNNVALYDLYDGNVITLNTNVDSLYKSFNRGSAWVSLNLDNQVISSNSLTSASIDLFRDTIIIAATYPLAILYSYDNGGSWFSYNASHLAPYNIGIIKTIVSPHILFSYQQSNKVISKSVNGGATWYTQSTNASNSMGRLYDFYFVDKKIGFACGDSGVILRTTNGGGSGVGVEENNSLKKKIKIFPNPAKQMIHIETDENIHFTSLILMDNQGKKVREYKKDERELNISGLSSGIYFLKLQTKQTEVTEKIVLR